MPIEKGEAWGAPGRLPPESLVATSDAQVASLIGEQSIVGLEAGDLARTLGIRSPYDRTGQKHIAPVDALVVELDDGSTHHAIAHVVAGRLLRARECVAIMNAAFIGPLNIAPRSHPGDGKADVITMDLGLADRFKAWRRMPTGSHLPHPGIKVSRNATGTIELNQPTVVHVDGKAVGRTSRIRYSIEPDAITIAI